MRVRYRLVSFVWAAAVLVGSGITCAAQGQSQGTAGGGSLPGDAMGGAALIFRKPENPPLHGATGSSSNSASGGKYQVELKFEPQRRPRKNESLRRAMPREAR